MENFLMNNDENLCFEDNIITISKNRRGRKINLFISDWNITKDEMKEHLKNLKKSLGCNGSIKTETIEGVEKSVLHLQGDHTEKIKEYLINNNIDKSKINIKE